MFISIFCIYYSSAAHFSCSCCCSFSTCWLLETKNQILVTWSVVNTLFFRLFPYSLSLFHFLFCCGNWFEKKTHICYKPNHSRFFPPIFINVITNNKYTGIYNGGSMALDRNTPFFLILMLHQCLVRPATRIFYFYKPKQLYVFGIASKMTPCDAWHCIKSPANQSQDKAESSDRSLIAIPVHRYC